MDLDGEGASFDTDECESNDDDRFVYHEDDDDEDEALLLQMVLNNNKSTIASRTELQQAQNNNGVFSTPRKTRTPQPIMWTDDDGTQRPFRPQHTWWYNAYVLHPRLQDATFLKKFRVRFRLPYPQFRELHERLQLEPMFRRWRIGTTVGFSDNASTPIPLLLLTSLRYLGRGWTFDDLSENTAISQHVIRDFFHVFIDFGSTTLYYLYVRSPLTTADAEHNMQEYSVAGFPGAIGSTDATHIMLERVQYRYRQAHLGFKMTHTARTYNITVNHRRRILSTTRGHPARWNDKTLALFDDLMQALHQGTILDDVPFELYAYDSSGAVVKQKYRGAWLLVDNGYLAHPTTVPPIKTTTSRAEIRFSAWLESLRKDVECTFGILKGRWRILKAGVRLHGVEAADKIFTTCCALHNWLLEVDGLDERWEEGVASDWNPSNDSSPSGEPSTESGDDEDIIPDPILRLRHPASHRSHDSYDSSGMGVGNDMDIASTSLDETDEPDTEDNEYPDVPADHVFVVRELSLQSFRSRLVTHFDIAFQRNEIKWPRRLGREQPSQHI